MGEEFLKIKHLIWAIGAMIFSAFMFGWNVNDKLTQVNTNKEDIEVLEVKYDQTNQLILDNHKEVMTGIHDLQLQLKDKKDRE